MVPVDKILQVQTGVRYLRFEVRVRFKLLLSILSIKIGFCFA